MAGPYWHLQIESVFQVSAWLSFTTSKIYEHGKQHIRPLGLQEVINSVIHYRLLIKKPGIEYIDKWVLVPGGPKWSTNIAIISFSFGFVPPADHLLHVIPKCIFTEARMLQLFVFLLFSG